MRAKKNKKRLNFILRLLVVLNVLNSCALLFAYLATHVSPNSFIYFSYFGLAYPVWLLVALLFVLFWLFFRAKFALISIITLLIGFNHFRHFFTFNFSSDAPQRTVKLVSYNVRIFSLYDKANRVKNRDEIFTFLQQQNAGIYCFQEYYHQENNTDFVTKEAMIPLLKTPHFHERYTHELSNNRYFGVATFSKYPIINKGDIPFENDPNNYCIYSDIKVNTDTFRVFNAHIGSIRFQANDYKFFNQKGQNDSYVNEAATQRILQRLKVGFEKRAVQAEKVAAYVKESPYPVILCGDLNDTPVSYCYRQFNRLLNDAFVQSGNGIGTTYIGEVPSNRIDYIFYSDQLKSANFTTHNLNCSDHRPISAEIGF